MKNQPADNNLNSQNTMTNNKNQPQESQLAKHVDNPEFNAEMLISQAIDKNVAVETMERLLLIRQQLKQEHGKEAFDRAMAQFQARMPVIEKKTKGYNYKYADLTTIIEQVKDLLSMNGFSYTFDTEEAENKVVIFCKVKHIGGHQEVSKAIITKETTTKMNASQQSGAAMTYGKRYAFVNAFGILTGDEDTDAGTPTTRSPLPKQEPEVNSSETPPMSIKQRGSILALCERKGKTTGDVQTVCRTQFHKPFAQLDNFEADIILSRLQALPDEAEEPEVDPDEAEAGIEEMNREPNNE